MVIQRSWKILSEGGSSGGGSGSSGGSGGGSTSASSTETNRSPSGLNTSSDDSNCSNQTTNTSTIISLTNSPLCQTSTNKFESQNAVNSDNMRFVTTPQMADSMLQKLFQRYNIVPQNNVNTTSAMDSAMRALELVRMSIQDNFDKEVHELIMKYIQNYFHLALQNIKENLGQNAVSDDMLSKMSCALLENAKHQYTIFRAHKALTLVQPTSTPLISLNTHAGSKRTLTELAVRNVGSTGDGDSLLTVEMPKRVNLGRPTGTLPPIKSQAVNILNVNRAEKNTQQLSSSLTTSAPSSTVNAMDNRCNPVPSNTESDSNVDGRVLTGNHNNANNSCTSNISATSASIGRRQIFWNTANISTTTKFVLDVQVNVAFGFGGDSKDRVASKHPELIRYLPDNDDRDWLVSQQIIAPQNRNSRFLFLIYDEVCLLAQTHEIYRQRIKVDLSLIMTFNVADFIVEKMKIFFIDLNIKSRGLITNSHAIDGRRTGVHGKTQTNQDGIDDNGNSGGSHLRNALLQGTASPPIISKVNIVTKPSSMNTAVTVKKHAAPESPGLHNQLLRRPHKAVYSGISDDSNTTGLHNQLLRRSYRAICSGVSNDSNSTGQHNQLLRRPHRDVDSGISNDDNITGLHRDVDSGISNDGNTTGIQNQLLRRPPRPRDLDSGISNDGNTTGLQNQLLRRSQRPRDVDSGISNDSNTTGLHNQLLRRPNRDVDSAISNDENATGVHRDIDSGITNDGNTTALHKQLQRRPQRPRDVDSSISNDGNTTGGGSMMLNPTKPKSISMLSSSHATLTALLNNSKLNLNSTQISASSTVSMISTVETVTQSATASPGTLQGSAGESTQDPGSNIRRNQFGQFTNNSSI